MSTGVPEWATECSECGLIHDAAECCPRCRADDRKDGTDENATGAIHPPTPVNPTAHYRRLEAPLKQLGTVGDAETLPIGDNTEWYRKRNGKQRCWRFADEFDEWIGGIDRSLYTTLNYQDPGGLPTDSIGSKGTTPEYGDIEAFALWTDFDLSDDLKAQRPTLDSETRAIFERALTEYVDRFADLAGGIEHVKLLDSVGGAYPIVPPTATAPIADAFEGEDRALVFSALCSRMRAWIDETTTDVQASVEGAETVVDADDVQNVNRQYKTLGSIHKSIDGVVHPLDPEAIEYQYLPIEAVTDARIDEWTEWAADFTDDRHREAIESIVATLWPEHYQAGDGWKAALRSWLEAREREENTPLADTDAPRSLDTRGEGDEAEVRDALNHLSPDLSREKWIRVGLALGDHFDRATARAIFTEWSRGGSKWDEKAKEDADDLIDRATGGGGTGPIVTIRTLFRYAIDAGWSPGDGDGDSATDEGEWNQLVALPSGSPKARVWDWRQSGTRLGSDDADADPWITRREAQGRTQRAIERAYESHDRVVVAALPGLGKSHGAILAAAETGTPVSFLTGRGRDEQYQVVSKWAEDAGLAAKVLPAVTEDCPTFADDFDDGSRDEEIQETVKGWYGRGATGKNVHVHGEQRLGEPLPCQADGTCPYSSKWDFDPDEYDVLIGHPNHIHVPKVANGRTPVIDEFHDSFENALVGDRLSRAVTRHLKRDPELGFENYTDLIENRGDSKRRSEALARLIDQGINRDYEHAFEDNGHALAPLATFVLLASAKSENQHENGFSTVELPGKGEVGAFTPEWGRENDPAVHLLLPPSLEYTRGVVGLDGTPTLAMWRLALGEHLNRVQVLDDDERRAYLTDTAQIEFVVTNDHARPVGGKPDDLPVPSAKTLARAVAIRHDAKPDLVTSGTVHGVLAARGLIDEPGGRVSGPENGSGLYGKALYHGNMKGSNRLKNSHVGVVEGSTHYGDEFVKKWGAFAGENVERGDGKGLDLSYGEFGDRILRHMRENQTLQGALRFGRDGNGATVYVNTNTLPEWVPAKRVGGVLTTKGDGERQVVRALAALGGEATRSEIQQHEGVSVSRQSIERVLNRLADDDRLEKEWDSGRNVYSITAFGDLNEHGEVDLQVGEGAKGSHDAHPAYSNTHRRGEHRAASSHDPVSGRSDDRADQGIETDGGTSIVVDENYVPHELDYSTEREETAAFHERIDRQIEAGEIDPFGGDQGGDTDD